MPVAHDIIIRPIITERSFDEIQQNKYSFEVAKDAHKIAIAQAISELFGVTVLKVNTLNVRSKPKRVRYALGLTRSWKKAIVTILDGQTIEGFGV